VLGLGLGLAVGVRVRVRVRVRDSVGVRTWLCNRYPIGSFKSSFYTTHSIKRKAVAPYIEKTVKIQAIFPRLGIMPIVASFHSNTSFADCAIGPHVFQISVCIKQENEKVNRIHHLRV